MEELANIVTVVEKVMGIESGKLVKSDRGCIMLAHVIREGYPHLMRGMAKWLSCEIADVHRMAFRLEENVSDDALLLHIMREIEGVLDMRPFKLKKKRTTGRKRTCLGVKFTPAEEVAMREAEKSSLEYMNKMCESGVQPLEDGCVQTRKTHHKWYIGI